MNSWNPWTADETTLLLKLKSKGLTCSQIAAKMPGRSRNSVIGRLGRMGMGLAAKPKNEEKKKKERVRSTPYRGTTNQQITRKAERDGAPPKQPDTIPVEGYVPPASQLVSFMKLSASTCRWPIGDYPPYQFCGGKPGDGPYCIHHVRMAYNPGRSPGVHSGATYYRGAAK